MINKFAGFDDNGKPFSRWTCGWCPLNNDGSQAKLFRTMNATKALIHVVKVTGFGVWPCHGRILPAKSRQYQDLHLSKTLMKEQRKSKKTTMDGHISDMQDQTVLSLDEGAKRSLGHAL